MSARSELNSADDPPAHWWQISEIEEPDSWLPVPRGLSEEDQIDWVAEVILRLKSEWGPAWDDEFAPSLASVLSAVSTDRSEDDGPAYLCWPVAFPVCTVITVDVVDSAEVPDWEADGYDVRYYETENLGPGILCTREREGRVAGQAAEIVATSFVFDDGRSSVLIAIDDVPVNIATLLNPDAQHFVASVALTRPDGLSFRAVPSRAVLTDAGDRWEFAHGN